ncbi:regulator [Vibrio parahaemolyticus]|uniref:regulator n=1 Tax=Vibrio parahaemolyticus TaxID=670 RepID=UPI00215C8FA6|nr:regulator [Vibrio parahaemolyticus]MCR9839905.1 regulator [Vibrio parahaemolyticus]
MTNFRKMSKNYVFREFECGLSVEETAKLCFKSVRAVKNWDDGKPIPPECKRLMRMTKGRELATSEAWEHFKMHKDTLELPTGQLVTPQEILTGIALLEIQSPSDRKIITKLVKYARCIAKLRKR